MSKEPYIYKVRPCNFAQLSNRCPICKESKGEKLILGLIGRLNIEYEKEKIFKSIYRSLLLCNKIRTLIILFK